MGARRRRRRVGIDIGVDEHQILDILEVRRRFHRRWWRSGRWVGLARRADHGFCSCFGFRLIIGLGFVGTAGSAGIGSNPFGWLVILIRRFRRDRRRHRGYRGRPTTDPAGHDDRGRSGQEKPEEHARSEGGLIDSNLAEVSQLTTAGGPAGTGG